MRTDNSRTQALIDMYRVKFIKMYKSDRTNLMEKQFEEINKCFLFLYNKLENGESVSDDEILQINDVFGIVLHNLDTDTIQEYTELIREEQNISEFLEHMCDEILRL